jgi:hypothetical protein
MVQDHVQKYPSQWSTVGSIAQIPSPVELLLRTITLPRLVQA